MNFSLLRAVLTLSFLVPTSAALASSLPAEVAKFVGKQGAFVSLYNEEETRESGGSCKVTLSAEGRVSIEAGTYFGIHADLEGAVRSVAGNGVIVYKLTDHGRRPGGSVCGDFVPVTSYKKTLEITDDVILVRQQFRCGFFDKYDIKEVCDLGK